MKGNTMRILPPLFVVACSLNSVSGFRWRRRIHVLQWRGGASDGPPPGGAQYSSANENNLNMNNNNHYPPDGSFPPDLPPPPFPGDPASDRYLTQQQQQQQQQQQDTMNAYYSQQAELPPPPPLPGSSSTSEQQPKNLYEQQLQQEAEMLSIVPPPPDNEEPDTSWDTTADSQDSASNRMDLSDFDKEYILRGLARLYRKKILPLELASRYGHFHSPPLSPSDFDAPPMILLLGQYSVGKTSFVKYLLGRDFPGIRIGPEPTTDRFTAILWGNQDKVVPGAALCSQTDRPFTGLNPFGNNFLSRLEGSELNAPILRNVTIVDTPGILSGQKQRSRNYDYEGVMKWFAERADLIIIMFDAHKLDISDELKRVMELMIPHLDKIRIVLNKADQVSTQQLMRVYGALMWSLGKVMNTPEVCRVYMGSFWDAPLQNIEQAELLQREEMDLLKDIMLLPQQAVMRRINEMVKRARSVKVHAYIIHYLRKQLPYAWGRREKQKRLIGRLESEFLAAARRYGLPKGDFPALEPMRQALYEIKDLSEFPKLDKKLVREMDKVFSTDVPVLLERARNH